MSDAVGRSVAGVLVLAFLVACARNRIPVPTLAPQPTSALVAVSGPPPPVLVEALPARPSPTAVWVDGEWIGRGGRWAWKLGRWVEAPRGARYARPTVVRDDTGAIFVAQGAWRDAAGADVPEPRALALAQAAVVGLVDPQGAAVPASIAREPADAGGDAGAAPAP